MERLHFYALMRYFVFASNSRKSTDSTDSDYKNWIRITKNLINNTYVDAPNDYVKAVHSIKKLSEHINTIYEYMSEHHEKVSFFSQDQKTEEGLKSRLILEYENWLECFINIEEHDYFDGQIGFILKYVKGKDSYDREQFSSYAEKLKMLFGDEFKEKHDFIFQRALLTKGNYLIEKKRNESFCEFGEGHARRGYAIKKIIGEKYLKMNTEL